MSGGEQRKLAILLGCAARPDVLILDEPGAGLDPIARRQLIDEIVSFIVQDGPGDSGQGHTVLFSTHIISDLERVADYIGVMDRGRIVLEEPLAQLQESIKRVQVVFPTESAPSGFTIPGAVHSETSGPIVTALVRLSAPDQLNALQQMQGARVNIFPVGLEDAVIQLLGQSTHDTASMNEANSELLEKVAS
jgi:ABC-2 type transport system ATP-binding protein